jgi:NADPH:quinone reductase-like Zn-dependent oxidoreductase
MRAVVIEKYGSVDELRIKDMPVPEIGDGDLLVEVYAAGVNPIDWKLREGYRGDRVELKFPHILGLDMAGIVKNIGRKVTRFQPGDEVFSRTDLARHGTYAEYVAVDETIVARKPENLTFEEAASIPLVGLTAWQALIDVAKMKKDEKVLIHAGSGGVGSFAIQLTKTRGAHAATTCSTLNVDLVKSLGADEVIDYTKEDFSSLLRDYDIVLDTMGGDIYRKSFTVLKKGGRLVSLLERPDEALARKTATKALYMFMQPNGKELDEIAGLLRQAKIKPVVGTVFPLEDVRKAQELSASHHAPGKIVLQVKKR